MSEGKTANKGKATVKGKGKKTESREAYILLDRTGSMSEIWSESVNSVNVFVRKLAEDKEAYRVTLAVFDLHEGLQFNVLRKKTPVATWKDFRENEAPPRGMTPLLDSLVRIIAMAEESDPDKAVIVVMTDGYENASREATLETARAAVERVEAKGWHVIFLGADFNAFDQAEVLSVKEQKRMNMSRGHQVHAMRTTACKSAEYFRTGSDIIYDKKDRHDSGEDKVK